MLWCTMITSTTNFQYSSDVLTGRLVFTVVLLVVLNDAIVVVGGAVVVFSKVSFWIKMPLVFSNIKTCYKNRNSTCKATAF